MEKNIHPFISEFVSVEDNDSDCDVGSDSFNKRKNLIKYKASKMFPTVGQSHMVREMAKHLVFTPAEIEAVLKCYFSFLIRMLCQGFRVRIPGLGHFSFYAKTPTTFKGSSKTMCLYFKTNAAFRKYFSKISKPLLIRYESETMSPVERSEKFNSIRKGAGILHRPTDDERSEYTAVRGNPTKKRLASHRQRGEDTILPSIGANKYFREDSEFRLRPDEIFVGKDAADPTPEYFHEISKTSSPTLYEYNENRKAKKEKQKLLGETEEESYEKDKSGIVQH